MPLLNFILGADASKAEKAIKKFDRTLRNFERGTKATGQTLTKYFTLPIMAGAAAATKAANDVDKSIQRIARGTGATGKNLEALGKSFRTVAQEVPQSFEQTATAIADLNTRTGATGKNLENLAKSALDTSRILGEDLGGLIAETTKAMNDWGVANESAVPVMDKLFKASQDTGISVTNLARGLYKYGSPLRQMEFDLDTTIGLLASFEKAGVNTELVLGSLRIALGKMASKGVSDVREGLAQIMEGITNAGSAGEAAKIAIAAFGSRAGPDMAAAIREGRFEVANLVESLQDSEGAIERAAKATKNLEDRWGQVKNKLMIAIEPMGKAILDLVQQKIPVLERKIGNLGETIGGMSDESRAKILKFALVFAAGGPLLLGLGTVTRAVRELTSALLWFTTSPAGLVTAAIAGMAVAMWDYANASEEAKKNTRSVMSYMGVSGLAKEARIAGGLEEQIPGALPNDGKITPDFYLPGTGSGVKPPQGKSPKSGEESGTNLNWLMGGKTETAIQGITEKYSELAIKLSQALGISGEEAERRLESAREIGELTAAEVQRSEERNALLEEARMISEQISEKTGEIGEKTSDLGDMTTLWVNDLSKGLADAIVNARDLGDVLENLLKQIASSALQKLIGGVLGGLFADGAAFSGGMVTAFASGGVVTSPTIFPMKTGMGLMGEAGPEAVMPLKRLSNGRLGVESQGEGGGTTVINHFNISAVDAKSFADLVARNPGAITSVVAGDYQNNGVTRRVIKGS